MAVPELQQESVKWQRRIALVGSQGLPTAPIEQLAKTDLQRIVGGGAPLTEQEVTSMVYGTYTGQQQVQQKSEGADFNPFHVVGHIASDIQSDVRSFLPGIIHEGADIINPNKWAEIPGGLGKTLSDLPNVSKAAKDLGMTPILGPLIPGTFALSAGISGATHHPLNFFLDVLPYLSEGSKLATIGVDVGADAAGETAMSAMKAGHPFQAVARASGLERRFTDFLLHRDGPVGELGLMPVWRRYNMIARVYSDMLVHNVLDELVTSGVLPRSLSGSDRRALVEMAQKYDPRYETQAALVDPRDVANAAGDWNRAFGSLPQQDVTVWTTGMNSTGIGAAPTVYFSEDQARASLADLGPDAQTPIYEGRVPTSDLAWNGQAWGAKSNSMIPNRVGEKVIHYDPTTKQTLENIRKFVDKYREKSTVKRATALKEREPANVLLTDSRGRTDTYRRDSLPHKKHEKYAAQAKEVNDKSRAFQRQYAKWRQLKDIASRYRSKKYKRFGESETDAAQRATTLPSTSALYYAAQPYILKGIDTPASKTFYSLDEAFKSGNVPRLRRAITAVKSATKGTELEAYANYLSQEVKGIGSAAVAGRAALRDSLDAERTLRKMQGDLQSSTVNMLGAQKDFYDALAAKVPESAFPLVEQQVRGRLIERATQELSSEAKAIQRGGLKTALDEAVTKYNELVRGIQEASTKSGLEDLVGADSLAEVIKEAEKDWQDMSRAGMDPIYIHKVNPAWAEKATFGYVRPLPDKEYIPKVEVQRALDFTPQVMDITVILPLTAMEYLKQEATYQFIDWMVRDSGVVHKQGDLLQDLMKRHKGWTEERAKAEINDQWVKFDPHTYHPKYDLDPGSYMMPKAAKEGFDRLMTGNRIPFKTSYDKVMRVYKLSVLTGPRHIVHVAAGGLTMMAIRAPEALVEALTHPMEVFKAAKDGTLPEHPKIKQLMDPEWYRENVRKGHYEETTDMLFQHLSAKRIGEWFADSVASGEAEPLDLIQRTERVVDKINNFENRVTDFYRSAIMLHDVKHGANVEAALAHVNKTLIDVDSMTPFERQTVRMIFPFWTFTRHILQYVLTLPADHPIRASILMHLSRNIEDRGASTDPTRLAKLFFLGQPDINGKIDTVDMSNLNPFRSMGSFFSMAGFLQGLNPGLQAGLQMVGVNPLTGTTSMHQNLTYDQYTGRRITTRPKFNPLEFVSTFVPEADIVDHYLLLTDTMRSLKKNNPEAYSRSLWQSMNMPFALAPINIYDIRAKAALAQFDTAQQAVADAMKTGETEPLRSYTAVPWQGQLYDGDQVANYIDNFDKLYPGIAPKAVYRKPRQARRKTL